MGVNTEITKYGVAVIESIPVGQLHTGDMLYNNTLVPQCNADPALFCDLYKVNTVEEFEQAIRTIIGKHQENEMLALHIETHGCEDGLGLASGELLPWNHFLDLCRELNNELSGLLVVTTALCCSLSMITAIDPSQRAPFLAVVITRGIVKTGEVMRGYAEYFKIYRKVLDIGAAKDALRQEVNSGTVESSPFEMITAAWLFDEITDIDRDTDAFKHIVNDWYCIRKSIDQTYTRERIEMEIRTIFKDLAENKRDYYLYKDLYK